MHQLGDWIRSSEIRNFVNSKRLVERPLVNPCCSLAIFNRRNSEMYLETTESNTLEKQLNIEIGLYVLLIPFRVYRVYIGSFPCNGKCTLR